MQPSCLLPWQPVTVEGKTKQPCYHDYSLRMRIQGCVSGDRLRDLKKKKNTDNRKSSVAYMLRLIFCRHGVIHTQSLQKLLLEDDVTKPEDMTGDIRSGWCEKKWCKSCRRWCRLDSAHWQWFTPSTHLFLSNLSMHSKGWMNCNTSSHWPSSTSCLQQ